MDNSLYEQMLQQQSWLNMLETESEPEAEAANDGEQHDAGSGDRRRRCGGPGWRCGAGASAGGGFGGGGAFGPFQYVKLFTACMIAHDDSTVLEAICTVPESVLFGTRSPLQGSCWLLLLDASLLHLAMSTNPEPIVMHLQDVHGRFALWHAAPRT